jgi:hydroxymethylbilane synthase
MTAPLRIGTRGSKLALWQATFVGDQLRAKRGATSVELVEVETAGDQVREAPLSQIGGDGLFTKAIQQALLAGAVDVAVHSLKDLPTQTVAGLVLAAVPPRGSSGDAFVSRKHARFDELPMGAVVATSSLRRRAQALQRRPDLRLVNIRGNVETRLAKLVEGDLDGLILAQAGLERLGRADAITELLDPSWMLPAIGQGALGLECRGEDVATRQLLASLDHPPTHQTVLAERAFLRTLGGGCLVPIGAVTAIDGGVLNLRGVVLASDGQGRVEGTISGLAADAEKLGGQLAAKLLERGAREILQAIPR